MTKDELGGLSVDEKGGITVFSLRGVKERFVVPLVEREGRRRTKQ